jgi:phosphinothricin acetyltransferase
MIIRDATPADIARMTEIRNHYIEKTHITFDIDPLTPEQFATWFHEHSDGHRYRMLVAEEPGAGVLGFAASGRFRSKAGYDTTVEVSIACHPDATGKQIGTKLYQALFDLLSREDIHRLVAGVALPNPASIALHERFGFKVVGTFTEVGRKFGKYWDVTWFEKIMHP